MFDEDPAVFSVCSYIIANTFVTAVAKAGRTNTDGFIKAMHRMLEPDIFGSPAMRVALPVTIVLAAAGAVLLPRGPLATFLSALLLALCALSVWVALRQRKAIAEAERVASQHRMLRESVENNPMPYAVYDDQDFLIAWNKAYEATHAEAFKHLNTRAAQYRLTYAELVRVTAKATLPPDEVEAHVAQRVRRQREADGVAIDREYPGLGWLRVCKFVTPSGAVAGFAVDINELKQREAALNEQVALSDKLARQLREIADVDALTQTRSRRAFLERADEEFRRTRRYGHPLSVAMLDIDAFKAVNDRYGHGAGDKVLAQVAAVCMKQLRSCTDCCGRLGGEEFAILLPETGKAGAQVFAERLCAAIRQLAFDNAGTAFGVSASIGAATLSAEDDSFATLLGRADAALYRAKASGRNRVVLA